jgi:hypothetical protein
MQFPSYIDAPITSPTGTDYFGAWSSYNRQVGMMSHELGHRWLSVSQANPGGIPTTIGTVHWLFGLHAPAPYPLTHQIESSPMNGAFWNDNGDGTFSRLGINFWVPATAYSYLDLYLMGLLPTDEVEDFFLVLNPRYIGPDGFGNPSFTGSRLDITVEDVIDANGPRLPPFETSQKEFNLGIVGMVKNGNPPSPRLLDRMTGIRQAFLDYWPVVVNDAAILHSDGDGCEEEICNGIDDDCDGVVDEGLAMGQLSMSLTPEILWPPDHKMVDVHATLTNTGGCSTSEDVVRFVLTGISSNEPDFSPDPGKGSSREDIQGAEVGSGDFNFQLRAERDGRGNGRFYELTYTAIDGTGNSRTITSAVLVPHDQGTQISSRKGGEAQER